MVSKDPKAREVLNPALRIIRQHEVAARLGLSPSKLFLMISEGRFPKPFRIVPNGRATGWLASDVDTWILTRRETATDRSDSL